MKPTHAYILIESLPGKSLELVSAIKRLEGLTNVHLVTGPYDVIAYLEAADLKSIGEIIVKKIKSTGFVSRTVTCIVVDED
ncbi:MAG: Lrp/AsnC ligand binding domain-containing protein [Candidatus Saganbacteria bacterium]|nr:Lrp/AsnC ligand binding domain-containing protein [Candidatus Saganbacteria bacterium]